MSAFYADESHIKTIVTQTERPGVIFELSERLNRTQCRIMVEAIEAFAASMKQAKVGR